MLWNFTRLKYYAKNFAIPFTSPEKMKPHIVAESILDVDFAALKREGFRHVVFDKDNTLTSHDIHRIENQDFVKKIAEI